VNGAGRRVRSAERRWHGVKRTGGCREGLTSILLLAVDAPTVAVYERRADEWIARRGETTEGLGRRFRREAGPGPVADLGCGAGRYLAELGPSVAGLDASTSMLALATRSGLPLVRGDLEALPMGDETLVGLFARHSYLHLPKDRIPRALGEARRVLRPGGLFLATLIEGDYEGRALAGDDFEGRFFSLWGEAEIVEALVAAGLGEPQVERIAGRGARRDLMVRARRPGR